MAANKGDPGTGRLPGTPACQKQAAASWVHGTVAGVGTAIAAPRFLAFIRPSTVSSCLPCTLQLRSLECRTAAQPPASSMSGGQEQRLSNPVSPSPCPARRRRHSQRQPASPGAKKEYRTNLFDSLQVAPPADPCQYSSIFLRKPLLCRYAASRKRCALKPLGPLTVSALPPQATLCSHLASQPPAVQHLHAKHCHKHVLPAHIPTYVTHSCLQARGGVPPAPWLAS